MRMQGHRRTVDRMAAHRDPLPPDVRSDSPPLDRCDGCGEAATPDARYCLRCGSQLRRGLPWYFAIPLSILGGCFAFFIGVLDDDGSANPDTRLMVEMAIVFGVMVAGLILWFTWLRHYVRRRSANAFSSAPPR
jgi:hypothetical protein